MLDDDDDEEAKEGDEREYEKEKREGRREGTEADAQRGTFRPPPPFTNSLYREEFARQYEQYAAQRDIFMAAPASAAPAANLVSFRDLLDFTAHVADCYPDLTRGFFGDISGILTARHAELAPDVREKIVGCLVLLHKKGLVESSMSVRLLYMCSSFSLILLFYLYGFFFFFIFLSWDKGRGKPPPIDRWGGVAYRERDREG
jgi:hypothetical protein